MSELRTKHETMDVEVEYKCGHVVLRKLLKRSEEEVQRFRDYAKDNRKCIDCTKELLADA